MNEEDITKEEEYLAGWKRAQADLENYKREEDERIGKVKEYVTESMVMELLEVLDNLERAEKGITAKQKKDSVVQGFLQISKQLQDFLKNQGVEEMEALGEPFEPALHEAVGQIQSKKYKSGEVARVVEKGYKRGDSLLRVAKVQIVA